MRIQIQVIPNASRYSVSLLPDGILKMKVMAPAVEGRANAAILEILKKKLKVKKVSIVRGDRSHLKTIDIEGFTSVDEIIKRLLEAQ